MPLAAAAAAVRGGAESGKTLLESFNYSGVRLLDGMLLRQCRAVRDTFLQRRRIRSGFMLTAMSIR
jgi:hypothetical protein